MTEISRSKLDHPDLATAGGAALHTLMNTMYTKLGDNANSRFFTYDTLANAASVHFDHNFKTSFSELSYNLYLRNTGTGELTLITETSTPSIYQFTLVARSSFETTQVTLTNNSGSSRDIALVLLQDSMKIKEDFKTIPSRYFKTLALAHGASIDFNHDFRVPFSELSFNLYSLNTGTGEHTLLTEDTSPILNSSNFTLIATPSFETTRVRLTNNSGSSMDLVLVCYKNLKIDGDITRNFIGQIEVLKTYYTGISPNQTNANLGDLSFSSSDVSGVFIDYSFVVSGDSGTNHYEVGTLKAVYDLYNVTWVLFSERHHNSGITLSFSITSGGIIRYTSSDWIDFTYISEFNYTIRKIKQTPPI